MQPDPDASLFQIKLISKLDPLLPQNIAKSWFLGIRVWLSTPPWTVILPTVFSHSSRFSKHLQADSGLGQATGGMCLSLQSPLPSCFLISACPGLFSHSLAPSSWKGGGELDNGEKGLQMEERKAGSDASQLWEPRGLGLCLPKACTFQRCRQEPCLSLAESEGSSGLMEQQKDIRGSIVYP